MTAVALAATLSSLAGCAVQLSSAPDIQRVYYPDPPPRATTETDYTRQFRATLREEAGVEPARRTTEEPVEETVRRVYP